MCCFSKPVKEVSGTKIFARAGEGRSQFLAYEMRVKAQEQVAMVLPVPVDQTKGEKGLRFIDLQQYPELFTFLEFLFTPPRNANGGIDSSTRTLEVQKVGAFEASFVPSIGDFKRLDRRFRLPASTWEALPNYKDWGFAVFKLRAGEVQYHPMAFSFDRKDDRSLFFPTVHIHDGKVHDTAHFDHFLYCQPGEHPLQLNGWIESQGPASIYIDTEKTHGIVDPALHCYRLPIKGRHPNRDTYLPHA